MIIMKFLFYFTNLDILKLEFGPCLSLVLDTWAIYCFYDTKWRHKAMHTIDQINDWMF